MKQTLKPVKLKPTQAQIDRAKLQMVQIAFSSQILDADIDSLEKMFVYRNKIKQYAKLLRDELKKELDGNFFRAFQKDEQLAMNISDNFGNLVQQIADMSVQERMYLSQRIPDIMQEEKNVEMLPLYA